MNKASKIYIAGHRGLAGSALVRELQRLGYSNLITRTHAELDLTEQAATNNFFAREKPDYVFLAAAKVGGIHANNEYPAEFIRDNLAIQTNVMHAAYLHQVKRLLFLGSSCIYPRDCPQPIKEEYLLTGPLEQTNRPYALAKIAGIEMCWSYNRQYGTQYLAAMPTNLYGPGDNYDLNNSHVLPALIRKMHLAKLAQQSDWAGIARDEAMHGKIPDDLRATLGFASQSSALSPVLSDPSVVLWGSGTPKREFLYSDDMAHACVYLMNLSDDAFNSILSPQPMPLAQPSSLSPVLSQPLAPPLINVGTGTDLTIRELAETIAEVVGYQGKFVQDQSKPDGTPRKVLDVSKMRNLGWKANISLKQGINLTYKKFSEAQP